MDASGLNQWKIGDVKVARVVELEGPRDGTFILPNGTADGSCHLEATSHNWNR